MNRTGTKEFRETTTQSFATPEVWDVDVPITKGEFADNTKAIAQNFVNAVLKDEPLISPGEEGARGLEIGNAMLMAGLTHKPVELPLTAMRRDDPERAHAKYGGKKGLKTDESVSNEMSSSFGRNAR
jgi:hypothetical protein